MQTQVIPRWLAVVLALALAVSCTRRAEAAPGCTPSPRPFVSLRFGEGVAKTARDRILREIEHELRDQQIDVCDAERAGAPVAAVAIDAQSAEVSIHLQVRDAVTSKDVERAVDTSSIPADGRALFVAVAAVDLLRASWAELALARSLPPLPAPPEVRAMVERALPPPKEEPKTIVIERVVLAPRPPPQKLVSLAGAFASEAFTTGLVRLGVDARVGIHPLARLDLGATFGGRRSLVEEAPHGSVSSDAIHAGLDARVTVTPPTRNIGLDAIARLDAVRMSFAGHASSGALASGGDLPSIELSAGARGWLAVTPRFVLAIELAIGAPVLAANATDDGAIVSSTAGLMVATSLSLGGWF